MAKRKENLSRAGGGGEENSLEKRGKYKKRRGNKKKINQSLFKDTSTNYHYK